MGGVRIRLLGPLEVAGPRGVAILSAAKERQLLAILAISANRPLSVDRLIDELWGGAPPPAALRSLRAHISRLRAALEVVGAGDRIVTRPPGYLLRVEDGELDADEFTWLVSEARDADAPSAADSLRTALRLWRGPALADVDTESANAERSRLEEARLNAVEDRIRADLGCGRHDAVIGELETLTAAHPLRGDLWAARMLALYRAGRQPEALRVFQELRRVWGEELGLEPGPELTRLEQQITLRDAALDLGKSLPTGVVTFLLTDIEGSTALWDADPDAMAESLLAHDRLIEATALASHGLMLKSKGEGDATVSVFARASDAATAALDIQRHPLPFKVRIGLHTGEAQERGGDYYGPTLNRAARLRGLAAGGQIFCSNATAELIQDRLPEGVSLRGLGSHTLRGISRPEDVFQLDAPDLDPGPVPVADGPPAEPSLPLPRQLAASGVFVGRTDPLARLGAAISNHRAALVGGEPGIGKTRLVAEAASQSWAEGAAVLYGRCDEDLAAPYQPFVTALTPFATPVSEPWLRRHLGAQTSDLARLMPGIGAGTGPDSFQSGDAEREQLQVFEAVSALLTVLADSRPVVLVLDDLHWATKPTLKLMRHLLDTTDITILATYRDTELDRRHPLAEMLADLRRVAGVERVTLRGLDEQTVSEYLLAAAGDAPVDWRVTQLAHALWLDTEGNPFFLGEILAHLVDSGAIRQDADGRWTSDVDDVGDLSLPEGVREVVGRRLSRLSPSTNQALAVAAIVGHEFALAVLEAVPEAGDPERILDALDEAIAAGLVVEMGPGQFAFSHALVRQTLVEELTATRRLRLHLRIAEALKAIDADLFLDTIAFHLTEAVPLAPAAEAADFALAATLRAYNRAAIDEGSIHAQRGLAALELAEPVDRGRRCDLLIEMARAAFPAEANHRLATAAADDARAVNSPSRLARAVIVYSPEYFGVADAGYRAMSEEALTALGDDEPGLRAQVLARLAEYGAWNETLGVSMASAAEDAVALARASGDAATLGFALDKLLRVLIGSPDLDRRAAVAEELLQLGLDTGNRLFEFWAYVELSPILLSRGNLHESWRREEQAAALSPVTYRKYGSVNDEIVRLLLRGEFDEAIRLAAENQADNPVRPPEGALEQVFAAQLLVAMREQGRFSEMVPALEQMAADYPRVPLVRVALANALTNLGRTGEAAPLLRRLLSDDLDVVALDPTGATSLCLLAEACAEVADGEGSRRLRPCLQPYHGQVMVLADGVAVIGVADHFLGLLAVTLGDLTEAERLFDDALELENRMEAPPLLARTQLSYARLLRARDAEGDAERARALAQLAIATADRLGMVQVGQSARQLLDAG